MHFLKPLSTIIPMAVCLSMLIISSSLANGLILGVIARFKKLRTFTNILLANAALVDLLNALINMPTYLLYGVLEVSWLKGKTLAIFSVYLSRLFIFLHLVSILSLLVNAFLGIAFDFRYFAWKTKQKAICVVVLEWVMSLVTLSLFSIPLFSIDLQDAHLYTYRQHVYSEYKTLQAAVITFFISGAIAFGALSVYSIRRRKLQVSTKLVHELRITNSTVGLHFLEEEKNALVFVTFLVTFILNTHYGYSKILSLYIQQDRKVAEELRTILF